MDEPQVTPNAVYNRRHREGMVRRMDRIETAVERLPELNAKIDLLLSMMRRDQPQDQRK